MERIKSMSEEQSLAKQWIEQNKSRLVPKGIPIDMINKYIDKILVHHGHGDMLGYSIDKINSSYIGSRVVEFEAQISKGGVKMKVKYPDNA